MSLRVTPLYGSYTWTDTPAQPPSCTLIEYAGVRLLIDVGMDESSLASESVCEKQRWIAEDLLPSIDAVLVCDSGLASIGGLPMVLSRLNLDKKRNMPMIYGTFPTAKLGQMSVYDWHARCSTDGDVRLKFSLDDVDAVFSTDRFFTMKYSQIINLQVNGKDALSITPHRSGRYVGGAFWVIKRLQDESEIVVAPNYNHAKERHLDACELPKYAAAADVLITRPGGPGGRLGLLYSSVGKKSPVLQAQPWTRREGEFIDAVMSTLRRGGNVLVPVDASGRVIELLLLLSAHWKRQRLDAAYQLAWVGPMAWNTANFSRSQLEWMAAPLGRQFDSLLGHPLALKNVKICSSIAELENLTMQGLPMVVLASGASLDSGPARDLLLKYAENQDNGIVMITPQHCIHRHPSKISSFEKDEKSYLSAAAQLLDKWCDAKAIGEDMEDSITIDVLVPKRRPLEGEELKQFLLEEEIALKNKQDREEKEKLLKEVELAKGRLHLGEEGDTDPVPSTSQQTTSNVVATKSASSSKQPPNKKSRFDSNLFLKFSKPNFMSFQTREEAVGISYPDEVGRGVFESSVESRVNIIEDDYGIGINPDHFIDIITGIDPSKTGGKLTDDSLRRGFGFGVGGGKLLSTSGGNIQKGMKRTEDEEFEEDDQYLEVSDLAEGKGIIRGRNGKPPIKVFTVNESLEVLAEISYVPLEGRVNAKSARQSVRALQPQQMIILGGGVLPREFFHNGTTTKERNSAASNDDNSDEVTTEVSLLAKVVYGIHSNSAKNTVHIPTDGEMVEIDVGHAAYPARLVDIPYQSRAERLAAAQGGDGNVAKLPLRKELRIGEYTVSLIDSIATGQQVKDGGMHVLAPRPLLPDSDTYKDALRTKNVMISDGDILLTDLRSDIIAQGLKAEYSTHVGYQQLIVNSKIVLRRRDGGRIQIEGPLCEDFFSVRRILCSHYITL